MRMKLHGHVFLAIILVGPVMELILLIVLVVIADYILKIINVFSLFYVDKDIVNN